MGSKLGPSMQRYGVEGAKRYKPDSGKQARSIKQVDRELAKAAMNDYDTRRTLEAAGLSGNEEAAEMSAKGFSNANDVYQAQQFFADAHKNERGLGGKFSSNRDFAGLTDYYVRKDREKLMEQMGSGAQNDSASEEEKPPAKTGFGDGELSPEAAKAFGYVDAYEDREDGLTDYSMTNTRFGNASTQASAAQEFSDVYKEKVKKRLAPTFKMDKIFTGDGE